MRYPFRFTKLYIADINEIVSAELVNSEGSTIMLTFKTGDSEVVECDSVHNCKEIFEEFCKACRLIVRNRMQGEINEES
jgi:hypothetical protein